MTKTTVALILLFSIVSSSHIYSNQFNFSKINSDSNISESQSTTENQWKFISLRHKSKVAIKADGTLWVWGSNKNKFLGPFQEENISKPMQIGKENNWKSISSGALYSIAIKEDGTMWAWGLNIYSQLGIPRLVSVNTPTQIGKDSDWNEIICEKEYAVAKKNDGSIWAWGRKPYSQAKLITVAEPTKIDDTEAWQQTAKRLDYK